MEINKFIEKSIWAVVGASENKGKYGYKIFKRLKQLGYKVYPVNPNYNFIDGEKCYPNITSLPELPEVVNMVVAPKHGIKVVEEAGALGIKYLWLQPGTASDELLKLSKEKGIDTIQACVLIKVRTSPVTM